MVLTATASALMVAMTVTVSELSQTAAQASGGSAQLQPASGQFFAVAAVKVADTRDGTGGVPAQPVASGGTITFAVTGAGQVPQAGVSDVYVLINAINPQYNGCLNDYAADFSNPSICTVSFEAGQNMSDADLVGVSSSGKVSVTNESGGTTDVSVSVMGYFQDDTATVAGQTYVPLSQAQIVDTRSGLGAPQAQIAAGGSLTVQVAGNGGVPSDAAGAALFIGAANTTANGYVSAYPASGTDSGLAILSYVPNVKARDLYFGALPSSGQLTLVNHGSAPVDLMVGVQGYLVSPSATEAGSEYQDVPELRIVDTRDGTGGVPAAPLPAGGSITFAATGAGNVPAHGVSSVAESVAAIGPTASGYLSVYPAGGTDPGNPGVNFTGGDYQDNDMSAPVVSAVNPAGGETVTNHSSGTVDVVVSVRGFYVAPSVPADPSAVSATVSGQSATVTWSPAGSDGGATLTGYTITASPDNATVTVGGGTLQATLTGLAHASADSFTVTAANAVGASGSASYGPPGVIAGTVSSPNGNPVSGAPVTIYSSDVPAGDPSGWTPATIGTTTTDASGIWTFTVPPYSALPAGAQAAADNNGGWLNMDVNALANATVGATDYSLTADTGTSAWVGTSTQPSGPVAVSAADASPAVMTVTPGQADLSAQDTTANETSTWTYQHAPALYDSSGNLVESTQDPAATPPTDSYGYQNLAGPVNDGYNPFQAADGTLLSNVSAQGGSGLSCNPPSTGYEWWPYSIWIWKHHLPTVIGEYHINWDGLGFIYYDNGSSSNIGFMVSADALHFHFDYYQSVSDTSTGSQGGMKNIPAGNAGKLYLDMNYIKTRTEWYLVSIYNLPLPNTPPPPGATICQKRWYIQQDGIYAPNGTNPLSGTSPGSDLSKNFLNQHDGISGYDSYLPRSQKFRVPWGSYFAYAVTHGTGYTYSSAATIFGIGIQAETDHSSDTWQEDDWLGGCRNTAQNYDLISGRKDCIHWAWGSNEPANNAHAPKIFYNY